MIRLRQVRAEALQEGRLEPRRDILLAPRLGGERLGAGDTPSASLAEASAAMPTPVFGSRPRKCALTAAGAPAENSASSSRCAMSPRSGQAGFCSRNSLYSAASP